MHRYRLGLVCPTCDEVIIHECVVTDLESDDLVMLEDFEQMVFHCDKCGTDVITMEADNMYVTEGGEDWEEDEEDDEV